MVHVYMYTCTLHIIATFQPLSNHLWRGLLLLPQEGIECMAFHRCTGRLPTGKKMEATTYVHVPSMVYKHVHVQVHVATNAYYTCMCQTNWKHFTDFFLQWYFIAHQVCIHTIIIDIRTYTWLCYAP